MSTSPVNNRIERAPHAHGRKRDETSFIDRSLCRAPARHMSIIPLDESTMPTESMCTVWTTGMIQMTFCIVTLDGVDSSQVQNAAMSNIDVLPNLRGAPVLQ